jgi:hypothetical protein
MISQSLDATDGITPLELVVLAPRDPIRALRAVNELVTEALSEATSNFNPFESAAICRVASATLPLIAEALYTRSLQPPWVNKPPRRERKKKEIEEALPF